MLITQMLTFGCFGNKIFLSFSSKTKYLPVTDVEGYEDFVEAVAHVVAGEGADGERVAEQTAAGYHHHQQADAAAELKTECLTRVPATNRTLDKLKIASRDGT